MTRPRVPTGDDSPREQCEQDHKHMAQPKSVAKLETIIRREVAAFCRRLDPLRDYAARLADSVRRDDWRGVFFGGTVRSLLVSRLGYDREGRPRDVDVVVQGPPLDLLRKLFERDLVRETRFGGLQLCRGEWQFDVWPLDRTWAIVQDRIDRPDFVHLPYTTFLNVEAIAIDAWTIRGQERQIYSGDGQFFDAIVNREVEINRAANPFPELCVVRSLLMACELGFRIGPRLARYIADHGSAITAVEFEQLQQKHYGHNRVGGGTIRQWVEFVSEAVSQGRTGDLRVSVTPPACG